MRGYPKHFNTKEDYENVLRDFPEWGERVIAELKEICNLNDDKMVHAIKPKVKKIDKGVIDISRVEEEDWETEEVENPNPVYRQKGFSSREEINELLKRYGGQ